MPKKAASSEKTKPKVTKKKPVKVQYQIGRFGTIYTQFQDKPKEAIRFLIKHREGECIKSLKRHDIGYIDIVWGENDENNKGYGLKHIIEKHGTNFEGRRKQRLLTSFDLRKKPRVTPRA